MACLILSMVVILSIINDYPSDILLLFQSIRENLDDRDALGQIRQNFMKINQFNGKKSTGQMVPMLTRSRRDSNPRAPEG